MNLAAALDHHIFPILSQCAKQLNLNAYVIGGYVRDHLLERVSKDVDIVVEGRGIDLAQSFSQVVKSPQVVIYANFGTAMVKTEDWIVEFVGARKESYRSHSRKPIVAEGSLRDDQLRRDFTINALSISLQEDNYGELIDPFEGVQHLAERSIRTPTEPDITFSDDPLRMLRAIRFATQLDFVIYPETFEAIKRNKSRIDIISKERIIEELNKIILADQPSRGFDLTFKSGLLKYIFPELSKMHGVEYRNGRGHKDNFYHTLKVLDNISEESSSLWLRWVALLHDIAKPLTKRFDPAQGWTFHGHEDKGARMVPKIFRKMKLPMNEHMKYVQKLVRLHQRPIALVTEEISDSAIRRLIFEAGDDLEDLLQFCRADITSQNENKVRKFLHNYDQLAARIVEVEERDKIRNWQPPISGNMIMEQFNIAPGRSVGQIKTAIREAILDGVIPNEYEAAFSYMLEIAPTYLPASRKKTNISDDNNL